MVEASDLGPSGRLVFHYTKASTALERILASMTIRLGPMHDTNDPWEGRSHRLLTGHGEEAEEADVRKVSDEVNNAKSRARVACFCLSDENLPRPRVVDLTRSSNGWARDRMWAQYADGHRGVCLCFDRDKLVESCGRDLAHRGVWLDGEVSYGDAQFDGPPHPDLDASARCSSPREYALKFRSQHARLFFFAKRQDWRDEREWRIVLFDDSPDGGDALLRIGGALTAIVVGHRFADAYHPTVRAICERMTIKAFKFMYSGIPGLSRYDLEPVRAA